jgi:hypothetical protein
MSWQMVALRASSPDRVLQRTRQRLTFDVKANRIRDKFIWIFA